MDLHYVKWLSKNFILICTFIQFLPLSSIENLYAVVTEHFTERAISPCEIHPCTTSLGQFPPERFPINSENSTWDNFLLKIPFGKSEGLRKQGIFRGRIVEGKLHEQGKLSGKHASCQLKFCEAIGSYFCTEVLISKDLYPVMTRGGCIVLIDLVMLCHKLVVNFREKC